jgi:RNA polymerase sigma-70 factor (ECF subfamily)
MQPPIVDAPPAAASSVDRREFEAQLLGIIPELRAFARLTTGSQQDGDDLVQDTIARCLHAYRQFDLQTSIKAWSFTILRNLWINSFRKRRYEHLDEETMETLPTGPRQEHALELKQVLQALQTLPAAHRDVIILVRTSGLSYEEAAAVMGCKIGTIKSRLNRADAALRAALGADFRAEQAAVATSDKQDGF